MSEKRSRVIRASEIGEYLYCHRAWWLGRVVGVANANRGEMDAGTARHRAHGRRVWGAVWFRRGAVMLVVLALIVAIALIAVSGVR